MRVAGALVTFWRRSEDLLFVLLVLLILLFLLILLLALVLVFASHVDLLSRCA
jgi:hypothetical protein